LQVTSSNLGRSESSKAPGQYSKYGLDDPGNASRGLEADAEADEDEKAGEANGVDDQGDSGAARRHLSAAERKAIKKVRLTMQQCHTG